MLPALTEIETENNEVFEEEVRTFRHRGPVHILDKIQQVQIRLQNFLFQQRITIDSDINNRCSESASDIVKTHQEALHMKGKSELLIAVQEQADNKLSTRLMIMILEIKLLTRFGLDFVQRYFRILQKRMNLLLYHRHTRRLGTIVRTLTFFESSI